MRMQARLRYHQTAGTTVEVLAIVAKSGAEAWLAQFGYPEMTEVPLSEVKDAQLVGLSSKCTSRNGEVAG